MAYNEKLADRVRELIALKEAVVEEKKMFGGLCFMVDGKMCVGISGDELMCRIGKDAYEEALKRPGCREMDFTGKPMQGYVFVGEEGMKTKAAMKYWVDCCLRYIKQVKALPAKKKKVKKK